MSKTAVAKSGEVNVTLASHLSKVPAMATDAFTLNLIELSALTISKTGTPCAGVDDAASPRTAIHDASAQPFIQFILMLLFEPESESKDVVADRFAQRRKHLGSTTNATPRERRL